MQIILWSTTLTAAIWIHFLNSHFNSNYSCCYLKGIMSLVLNEAQSCCEGTPVFCLSLTLWLSVCKTCFHLILKSSLELLQYNRTEQRKAEQKMENVRTEISLLKSRLLAFRHFFLMLFQQNIEFHLFSMVLFIANSFSELMQCDLQYKIDQNVQSNLWPWTSWALHFGFKHSSFIQIVNLEFVQCLIKLAVNVCNLYPLSEALQWGDVQSFFAGL